MQLRLLAAIGAVGFPAAFATVIDQTWVTSTDGPINSGTWTVENDGDMLLGEIHADTANGVSGTADITFNGLSPLYASVLHAVTGGSLTFNDIAILSATATDAVTAGDFTFNSNSSLYAAEIDSVSGGTLRFFDNAILSTTAEDGVFGATIELHGNSSINVDADDGLCGGSTISFDGSLGGTGGTLTLNGNDVPIGAISSASGGVIRNQSSQSATLTLDFATINTFNGLIEDGAGGGALAVQKYGVGALLLGGSNTYTGGTALNDGILRLGDSGSVLSDTGALVINGGIFFMGRANETVGSLSGFGGELRLFDDLGAGRTLTVNQLNDGFYVGGIQGDDGALVKTGPATLELYGDNTYTGGTTISAGALNANSGFGLSATGTGTVTVTSAGTLGGNGYLTGEVVMNGTLSPGTLDAKIGTLSTGAQVWGGGATYQWQINDALGFAGFNYDTLGVDGVLDVGIPSGIITISLNTLDDQGRPGRMSNFASFLDYSWDIARASFVDGFNPANFAFDASGFANGYNGTFSVGEDGGVITLVYTGVPNQTINSAYTTSVDGAITHGVYDVVPAGSVTVDTADGFTAGDLTFYISTPLSVTVTGGATGGYLEFFDDSTATVSAAGAVDDVEMVFHDDAVLSLAAVHALGAPDGLSSTTRLRFFNAGGAPALLLNGNDTIVASIQSSDSGGRIANGSAASATLTIKSGAYDSDLTGMLLEDGAGGGTLSLVKDGSSRLVMGSANTYTGGTTLKAGELVFADAGALGTGPITITGGTFTMGVPSVDPFNPAVVSLGNPLTLGGNFTIDSLAGDIDYLEFSGGVALATGIVITNRDDITFSGDFSGAHDLTLHGLGVYELDGNNAFTSLAAYSNIYAGSSNALGVGTVTFYSAGFDDGGGTIFSTGGNPLAFANNMVFNAPTPFIADDGDITLTGALSGVGGIVIPWGFNPTPGLVTISGTNTSQFGTFIQGGNLAVGSNSALGAGPLVLYAGSVRASGGARTVANTVQAVNMVPFVFAGSNALAFTGPLVLGDGMFVTDVAMEIDAPVEFSGTISGDASLHISGTDTIKVSSSGNTLSGQVFVEGGTLLVTGSIASSPLTTVQTGGTLAGSGTVGGLLVADGGILSPGAPGAPIATLSSAGQTWGEDGIFAFDINNATGAAGTSYDTLGIAGALSITATGTHPFVFRITTLNGSTPGNMANYDYGTRYAWLVAQTASGISGPLTNVTFDTTGFSNPNLPAFSLEVIGNSLYLVAVPEPAEWGALLGLGLLALVLARRLRRTA